MSRAAVRAELSGKVPVCWRLWPRRYQARPVPAGPRRPAEASAGVREKEDESLVRRSEGGARTVQRGPRGVAEPPGMETPSRAERQRQVIWRRRDVSTARTKPRIRRLPTVRVCSDSSSQPLSRRSEKTGPDAGFIFTGCKSQLEAELA